MCVCVCVLGISCSIHGLWCEIRESGAAVLWRSTETHGVGVETSTWPAYETTSAHPISLSLFRSLALNYRYFKLLYTQHQCTSGEVPFYCIFLKFQIIGKLKVCKDLETSKPVWRLVIKVNMDDYIAQFAGQIEGTECVGRLISMCRTSCHLVLVGDKECAGFHVFFFNMCRVGEGQLWIQSWRTFAGVRPPSVHTLWLGSCRASTWHCYTVLLTMQRENPWKKKRRSDI